MRTLFYLSSQGNVPMVLYQTSSAMQRDLQGSGRGIHCVFNFFCEVVSTLKISVAVIPPDEVANGSLKEILH